MVAQKRPKFTAADRLLPLLEKARQQYESASLEEAEKTCGEILQQQRENLEALYWLASIAASRGNHEQAIARYEEAVQFHPHLPELHYNFANTLKQAGQIERAIAHYREAIAKKPEYANAHYNLANLLQERKDYAQAIAHYREALGQMPRDVEIHTNLGNALKDSGNLDEAIAHYREAIALTPEDPNTYYNLAIALHDRGDLREAIAAYDNAIALDPESVSSHWNRALSLLLSGDYVRGFAEYEWRWHLRDRQPRPFSQPQWDGSDLAGRRIVLHAEQGLGDTLQFIRYVPLVAQRGGRVILECHPPLVSLLQHLPGIEGAIARHSPLPEFDLHAPLMSLPHIFGTTLETIPATVPYIPLTHRASLPPAPLAHPRKIGIVWAANSQNPTAGKRSCPLGAFLQLLEISGITLYVLQKEIPVADKTLIKKARKRYGEERIKDLSGQLHTFRDTAALINELELVISVDTAVAHLGGGMGLPVWVVLPFAPDWRWMLHREDSPWYPTLRLFRQSRPGDWQSAMERIKIALANGQERTVTQETRKPEKTQALMASNIERQTNPEAAIAAEIERAIEHHRAGRLAEAMQGYRRILQQQPHHPMVLNNLGMALKERGEFEEAIACYETAIAADPEERAALHYNLANALWEVGRFEPAIAHYHEVIAREPEHLNAYNNLGMLLQECDRPEEAIAYLTQAIKLNPNFAKAHNNLGLGQQALGDLEAAIASYRTALRLYPEYPEAHNNLGVALLLAGELTPGFIEYEWRWRVSVGPDMPDIPAPLWDGSNLQGKTILLHSEQGFGDIIQFIRYAPLVAQSARCVVVRVPQPLERFCQTLQGIDKVSASLSQLGHFDVWAPLMSLPRLLGTTLDSIPAQIPYLAPPTQNTCPLPAPRHPSHLKVGIVWSGNPNHPNDRTRSVPFSYIFNLLEIPGIQFYSLQKGQDELSHYPQALNSGKIVDCAPQLNDFADTAAMIAQLDLVISPDTSVAHVAGALGKPVWLLLAFAPDWRWMRDREDSPWYPTLRIFRQTQRGDWPGVFQRISAALKRRLAEPNRLPISIPKLPMISAPPIQQKLRQASAEYAAENYAETEQLCREIVQQEPLADRAWQLLGNIAHQQGKLDTAVVYYKQAIAALSQSEKVSEGQISAYINLGAALRSLGKPDEAIAYLQQAIALIPDCIPAHYNLGNALYDEGKIAEAIASYKKVIALDPTHVQGHYNLGNALEDKGETAAAIASLQRALELNPNHYICRNNLGNILSNLGRFDEALAQFDRAIALDPTYIEARVNRGNLLYEQCRIEEAIASYQDALAENPEFPDAHLNLALGLLLAGNLRAGFAEYEWRWRIPSLSPLPVKAPIWDGSDLQGKTILLHAEQGFGDTLQFIRYAPFVAQLAGRVILRIPKQLIRLLENAAGIDEVMDVDAPLPEFDAWAPLMSLPHIFGTTLETIPADIPYLQAPNQSVPASLKSDRFKVGLVWAGSPEHTKDAKRSCGVKYFKPLLEIPGIRFYSLQKGDRQLSQHSEPLKICDLAPNLHDFADTAAAIAQLDLVITVDTSVAHLAAAMGKPVWVLLAFSPDWRWLLDREDNPWYPTVRVFRQSQPGDWAELFRRLAAALEETRAKFVANRQKSLEAEMATLRQTIAQQPHCAAAYYNLGNLLKKQGKIEEAIAHYRQAIALQPNYTNAYYNLANTLLECNQIEAAIGQYERVLALNPQDADSHTNLGFALLAIGDYARGFAEYEWRRKRKDNDSQNFDVPLWDGSELSGRGILLHCELGFGDSIQFIRYVPAIAQRGGRVIVQCPPELVRLFETVAGVDRAIPIGEPLPPFEFHAPLMSLPRIFRTTLTSIPAEVPYLCAPAPRPALDLTAIREDTNYKIGIVWAGSPRYGNQRDRACGLEQFLTLTNIPNLSLYSLQKGERVGELTELEARQQIRVVRDNLRLKAPSFEDFARLAAPPDPANTAPRRSSPIVRDCAPQIEDFADTAAIIAELDVVITVDTSVAHLAGALGKPVWVVLPFAPDWRWMRDREDSPWYPTMRLFRQTQPGDWQDPFDRVVRALSAQRPLSPPSPPPTLTRTSPPSPMTSQPLQPAKSAPKPSRIGISWPLNQMTGWGIFGTNLALQLQHNGRFQPMLLMPPDVSGLVNPLQRSRLQPVLARYHTLQQRLAQQPGKPIWCDFPVLHALGNNFVSVATQQQIGGKHNIGVIFFEDTNIPAEKRAKALEYELIIAGSNWNAEVLKANDIPRVRAIPQGIDPTIFHPAPKSNLFGDRFVIFSGGKLEYRKGQDIVVAAFKAFQSRHPEALLIPAWHNFWPQFMLGMDRTGNVVGLPQMGRDRQLKIGEWLIANGLNADSFIELGAIPNYLVGQILREADVALFTNRCEGGTNLVAMESMACGIPTILSANTGHLDLIADERCYPLRSQTSVQPTRHFSGVDGWGESQIEEVVETLEFIYQNRPDAEKRGKTAADFMQNWTWEKQVHRIMDAIGELIS